jgi:hypothetical protein
VKAEPKKCCGFPEKGADCKNPASATVLRVAVCEEHARQAEANGARVVRYKKS